jgi:cytochrome c oxidase subunit 2
LGSGVDPFSVENYLLDVTEEVVVPVGAKVRVLIGAGDVLHSWWVPAFGVKKDAVPGFINESWFEADEEGTFRGQCAELCGMDHGFMPIVVRVVSQGAYESWLTQRRQPQATEGER